MTDGPASDAHQILFPQLPYDMTPRAKRATQDVRLQQFVNRATLQKDQGRRKALSHWFGDRAEPIRELAGQIKQHTLDHLDYYLGMFSDAATRAGAQVHYARDGEQANAICLDIARRYDCRLCVKSKSMVTEETQLVPRLEAIGCETVETDLGEFIIQLDRDAPSHIVTPMIHKDRVDTARAFERELGVAYTEDPDELTGIARQYLRQKYRRADLGISGANFLIAETGSVVLCTNEGNGRFCTSAPKVHVVYAGIEKLIPTLGHLSVLLKVLARSSTAQPLTCYTHIMTGPKRTYEPDGPEQMHIVLIDNGRTNVLQESTREMLRCIRCGACLNACPVYRKVGGHAYGAVYSGPVGAVLTPIFKGLANYPDLPHASSLCGACYEACPVKIDIPKQLIQLRAQMTHRKINKRGERLFFGLWGASLNHGLTYRIGGWMNRMLFRAKARIAGTLPGGDPYADHGWIDRLPGPIRGWTEQRDMPTPPRRSFRQWWKARDA